MKLSYLLFIILLTLCQSTLTQNISINQLDILDKLPSNSIRSIFQDKEGYIWFGTTEGLCRYDGYRIKTFKSGLNDKHLLSNNEINCITEVDKGKLLIGTKKGLNILDKSTYQINHFPDSILKDRNINNIVYGSDSTIWVSYNNGLNRYNNHFKIIERYMVPDERFNIPMGGAHVYEDSYKNIWVTVWDRGLYKLNKELNEFVKYPKIGEFDNPFFVFQDNKNNYWVGTWGQGLYQFFPNSAPENTYKKMPVPQWMEQNINQQYYSITQDQNNEYIWAMSYSGIITYKYNEYGNIEIVDNRYLFNNTNNIFSKIIKDNKGSLWIGAFSEGVYKIDFDKTKISNFPLERLDDKINIAPSFSNLCEDKDEDVWIKQNRGQSYVYSEKTKVLKRLTDFPELAAIPDFNYITYLSYIPGRDEIWACKWNESTIYKIKKKNGKIRKITSQPLDKENATPGDVKIIYEDYFGNVWISTDHSIYVQPANSENISIVHEGITKITSISMDINNNLWLSSAENGFYKIELPSKLEEDNIPELKNKIYQHLEKGKNIQALVADLSGNIWIADEFGNLFSYNLIDKTFKTQTRNCGLDDEIIYDLIVDQFNHLWIVSHKKIIEYNPENNASYIYDTHNGLSINTHMKGAFFMSKLSEKIYFGGNRGYSCITPSERLKQPAQPTKTILTDIKIQNESIINNKDIYNKEDNTLTLSPDDRNLEIHFSNLNYDDPLKIRYAYKLEGIDEDWIELKYNRQFVVFNQLKHGNYTFKVKSTDIHNLWSNNETKLTVIRRPAYYETSFAFFVYFVMAVVAISFLVYFIRGRIKLINKLEMAEFEKNKTDELTHLKLKYFTNISHDLLTPLTIISCIIDDIETTTPNRKKQIVTMRSNVVRLKRILQQILDFRRVEDGKMKLSITNSDITSFVKDICQEHFVPMLNKKQISFNFSSNPEIIDAYFDHDKVDKIIFNLLSNAYKYTPEKGEISIVINQINNNDERFISIEVKDTGIGIPDNKIKDIFTRFYTNRSMNVSNTNGIGLSLCKDLIELHHGSIKVSSIVDKGTTFTITLPIDKKNYSSEEMTSDSMKEISERSYDSDIIFEEEKSQEETGVIKDINLLVVEDNAELLLIMQQLLSKHYHVYTATNGIEAIEIINKEEINIIISDVMMPEMDGIELCRTIKENLATSHISVILLTAKNNIDDRIMGFKAGANAYISKPFNLKELHARIDNFVVQKQNKQESFKKNLDINISTIENHNLDKHFLKTAIDIIENNLTKKDFDVNGFASELNMSKSSLYRKIKSITGLSPVEFIRNIKLKHASELLKNNTAVITDVAYAVGFSDPKYFSSCFKAEFNITPKEFQKQNTESK
ncbi:hybrid sensor histidine kinase/response regulator transcription factor [Plebeiibacterium sediminum]|uniref:histidine kinase n=1 Tax=Plebeiibacterium sediminum TaxID=2992112 RepID=A0AAE3SDI4_9BACT|nr:hybrid sensor histidine kinase/response regulator transcription factor [Plebeiobacterium sediminum]MCW3785250.1 response regulator [Plebeiobacterium sediminum]